MYDHILVGPRKPTAIATANDAPALTRGSADHPVGLRIRSLDEGTGHTQRGPDDHREQRPRNAVADHDLLVPSELPA